MAWPEFSNPWVLWLLLLLPPLWWWLRRRISGALSFSDTRVLGGLPLGRSRRARWGGTWLRLQGLICLIVALAGPRWPDLKTRLPTQGIAIAMVVDISDSMGNVDFPWDEQKISRIEGVKKIFHLFVAGHDEGMDAGEEAFLGRPYDLVGLVTYARSPETSCPLTLDHQALLQILKAQQAMTADTNTLLTERTSNPGDAILWAVDMLQRAPVQKRVMVFLSDGETNVKEPALKPRQAAQLAGNLGIPIYVIHADLDALAKGNSPDAVKARKNALLAKHIFQDVARISSGQYFQARDRSGLLQVCQEIDKLEKQEIKTFQYRRYHEAYVWFALAALVSWLSIAALENTLWRRVP